MISTASTTLTRPKSLNSMGTIVVDMGDNPRGNGSDSSSIAGGASSAADPALQRLKSNGAIGVDSYSPVKSKTSRGLGQSPENVSVIHCIPLLMVFVFFVLWTASSEIKPEMKKPGTIDTTTTTTTSQHFEVKIPTPNKFATSEELKDFSTETSEQGTRAVSNHNNDKGSYLKGDRTHDLQYYRAKGRLPVRATYRRAGTR